MDIIYIDDDIIVCIKPARVLSTDEPGGLPDLLREELRDANADIRTVHRLDRVVSGLMVVARNPHAASELSRQIREGTFEKCYLAIAHGISAAEEGVLIDLLGRDKARKMTYVAQVPAKGVQKAILRYRVIRQETEMCRLKIKLETGRTHQIRVQFASRGMPLYGERKYAMLDDTCEIALWSYSLQFIHPVSGIQMLFSQEPPMNYPWTSC